MNFSKYTNTAVNNNNSNTSSATAGDGTMDPTILNQMLTSTTPVQIRTPIKIKPSTGTAGIAHMEEESAGGTGNATAGKLLRSCC